MKIFLLFYMSHFTMGLTHCYKTVVFVPPINAFARLCLSVCLSVCEKDYSKTRAWIWMKCCVSTDVGTWTNFEPDPDYSPNAGTGLLSPLSCKPCYAEFYAGKIRRIRIGRCSEAWF